MRIDSRSSAAEGVAAGIPFLDTLGRHPLNAPPHLRTVDLGQEEHVVGQADALVEQSVGRNLDPSRPGLANQDVRGNLPERVVGALVASELGGVGWEKVVANGIERRRGVRPVMAWVSAALGARFASEPAASDALDLYGGPALLVLLLQPEPLPSNRSLLGRLRVLARLQHERPVGGLWPTRSKLNSSRTLVAQPTARARC